MPFCSLFTFTSGLVFSMFRSGNAECDNAAFIGKILFFRARLSTSMTRALFTLRILQFFLPVARFVCVIFTVTSVTSVILKSKCMIYILLVRFFLSQS